MTPTLVALALAALLLLAVVRVVGGVLDEGAGVDE